MRRVEQWNTSGLTAREFAAKIGVNPSTLASWRRRLAHEVEAPRRKEPGRSAVPPFIEVLATPVTGEVAVDPVVPVRAEPLELMLAGGHRLRIPARFNADSLRRVLAALEDC